MANRYLYLNALDIEGISSNNETNSKSTDSFKIRIGNLSIQTEDFIFQSNESYINNINGNISIINFNGKLNNIFLRISRFLINLIQPTFLFRNF